MGLSGLVVDSAVAAQNTSSLTWLHYVLGDSATFVDLTTNRVTWAHCMYSGIDWIYTHVEALYMYDYKVAYFWLLNSVYDDSIDFFILSNWYYSLQLSGLELFWSVMLDNAITSKLLQLSLTDEWVRSFMTGKDVALWVVCHPEIIFYKDQIYNSYLSDYLADTSIATALYLETHSILLPITIFVHLMFIAYVIFIFAAFYFSYYSSPSKEESSVDADYLCASVTVESEKELGSFDDILLPGIIIVYTFGWYFAIQYWNLFHTSPEMILCFFFLPILYYTICNIPTFLLNDFGILYNCYLRGVVPSPSLVFELMFDYVAVISFYIRMLTQAVRLALMFLAYAGLHDYVIFMHYDRLYIVCNESVWEEISNIGTSPRAFTYFILGTLPTILMSLLYEVVHTIFVLTGQFVAYFGMIFWLFLFLFTFFIVEEQEKYFKTRKKFRQDFMEEIKKL